MVVGDQKYTQVMRLATSPNSWGVWYSDDPQNIPWESFLDAVVEVGFQHIEAGPYGYLPTDPEVLVAELSYRGLGVVAGQVHGNLHEADSWSDLEAQTRSVGQLVSALDGEYLLLIGGGSVNHVTNERLAPPDLSAEQWRIMANAIERIGRISQDDYGLRTVFHPTVDGFCDTRSEQIERLLGDTDPEWVSLCLDTGQFQYRNGDPAPFLETHFDHIPYVHCKDIVPDIHDRLAEGYIPFSERFCPIGEGAIDFRALIEILRQRGYDGFLVVDEDQYGAPVDRLREVSRSSFEQLSGLLGP